MALLLGPASAELELRALIEDEVSLRELLLRVLVLALEVPALPPLDTVLPEPLLVFCLSLVLNSLNFSSIDVFCLLLGMPDLLCEVGLGVEHCDRLGGLSGVADWLRGGRLRPAGVGIPVLGGEVGLELSEMSTPKTETIQPVMLASM